MYLAGEIDKLVQRGFSEERAQTIVLMREASILLFDAFPDVLVLVGGANLVLFQEGVRHSADLDFFPVSRELPEIAGLREVLLNGLKPLGELLKLNPLKLETIHADAGEAKLMLSSNSGNVLFTVDISRIGSVLQSEVEEIRLEATGIDRSANIKFVTRDQMLLHKAEAFLLRKSVKARDAYDAMDLMQRGATLTGNLKSHLEDILSGEFDSERLHERIDQVDQRRCEAELRDRLPGDVYKGLKKVDFQPVRDALLELFHEWL